MSEYPWFCWNREHLHSTEQEAEWCNELDELLQQALMQLAEQEIIMTPAVQKAMQRFHAHLYRPDLN